MKWLLEAGKGAVMSRPIVRVNWHDASHLLEVFGTLPKSVTYGAHHFPSIPQYLETINMLQGDGTNHLPSVFACAQLDWHRRGQSGCLFARLASGNAISFGWEHLVVASDDAPEVLSQLDGHIRARISDAQSQIMSLVWPEVQTAYQAVRLLRELPKWTHFWLERDAEIGGLRCLRARYPIEGGAQAWVMAFGPFDFLPNTRRAPLFELVVRIKRKPEEIFHRINQDHTVAHLADLPLRMSERRWEHRWQSTLRRTRAILGDQPDEVSAAKSTISVPAPLSVDHG